MGVVQRESRLLSPSESWSSSQALLPSPLIQACRLPVSWAPASTLGEAPFPSVAPVPGVTSPVQHNMGSGFHVVSAALLFAGTVLLVIPAVPAYLPMQSE